MEKYIVYKSVTDDIIIGVKSNENSQVNFVHISSYKNKSIHNIIQDVFICDIDMANHIIQTNSGMKYITLSKFKDFILNHKCHCSSKCLKFIWGGFYNIIDVGGVSVECFDRLSNNNKLNPFQVRLKILKKKY